MGRQTYKINIIMFREPSCTHPLTLSRTFEAPACLEVHGLHAVGEHDLVDSTYGREGEERGKDKVRKEEALAAEPNKRIK